MASSWPADMDNVANLLASIITMLFVDTEPIKYNNY